ncbi:hypothetical protein D3C80_1870150 [compost metagenome]
MLYTAITNLINLTIFLLSRAEGQAVSKRQRQDVHIDSLEQQIVKANEVATIANKAAVRCAHLRKKLETLGE